MGDVKVDPVEKLRGVSEGVSCGGSNTLRDGHNSLYIIDDKTFAIQGNNGDWETSCRYIGAQTEWR
jgi:hypothetical protein